MKSVFFFTLLFFCFSSLCAQVSHVEFYQEGSTVVVSYDLDSDDEADEYEVSLSFSLTGGRSYIPVLEVYGDVGPGISPGDKKEIIWLGEREMGDNTYRQARFKVTAVQTTAGGFSDYTDPFAGEMIAVDGGSFEMGDWRSDDSPPHRVTVSDFHLGKYEVTQAQWESVMGDNPSRFSSCAQCPVENVSWEKIQEFLGRLNDRTGMSYRLPTEAEWEYAAGGGSRNRTKYAGTNNKSSLGSYAWHENNFNARTHPVGEKRPNRLGLYDMSGNVWEWCSDWYAFDYYANSPSRDPQGPATGDYRVFRGGGWDGGGPTLCLVVVRKRFTPTSRYMNLGFRLAH